MCGIIGIVGVGGRVFSSRMLREGVRQLVHRGPDAEGILGWAPDGTCDAALQEGAPDRPLVLGLGHRRLSIFDLSEAGTQPMRGAGGEWIVYNGEVYNFLELREELAALGHPFHTETDTEVILAAYRQWGVDCVTRFNGMWAFALYDPAKNGMFWSRDRLGVKPFLYTRNGDLICLSSEECALFAGLGLVPRVDRLQLAKYLVLGISDDSEHTIYSGVYELRGGHSAWLELATGDLRTWRYWELPEEPDLHLQDAEALDRFSELLEDSVRLRLRADVPVAISLSGGVDSSAVTVAASRVRRNDILTFTSSFPEQPEIDESAYAAEVANGCRASPVFVKPDLTRLVQEEPLLTRHQAAPYGSLSQYVHWAILNRVKEHRVPVILSGQGGDELFLGYERYYVARVLSRFPNVPKAVLESVQAGFRSGLGLLETAGYVAYFASPRLRDRVLFRRAQKVFRSHLLTDVPLPPYRHLSGNRRELQANELLRGQLSHLLRYDDRTSGAHGMETRLPYLDYRMVEFAYRLPWHFKIRHGWTKYLVRKYLERHSLKAIAWRKRKLGFSAPQAQWTRHLIQTRGRELDEHPFRKVLLRDDVTLLDMPLRQQWSAYNTLHLASLLDWPAELA